MERTPKHILLEKLKSRGYSDQIISSFEKISRDKFVPHEVSSFSYEDIALPIGDGTTISQPSTIAFMLSLLELKQNQSILEIGSGSGYVLALISEIIKNGSIYGMEINPRIAINSKKILENNSNIEIINRSGLKGLPEYAPYDRILISATLPDQSILIELVKKQLKDQGILVAPVKQSIIQIKKINNELQTREFPGFSFVPFKTA